MVRSLNVQAPFRDNDLIEYFWTLIEYPNPAHILMCFLVSKSQSENCAPITDAYSTLPQTTN